MRFTDWSQSHTTTFYLGQHSVQALSAWTYTTYLLTGPGPLSRTSRLTTSAGTPANTLSSHSGQNLGRRAQLLVGETMVAC